MWRQLASRLVQEFICHDYLTHAAALAFFFMLALFPSIMLLASVVAYLSAPHVFHDLMIIVGLIAPVDSMPLLRNVVHDALQSSPKLLSFSIFGTLFAASGGFTAMINALNIAYEVRHGRPYWKKQLVAILLTTLVGVMTLAGLAAIVVGPQFGNWLSAYFGVDPGFAAFWPYLRWIAIIGSATVSVELLYFVAPNLKQRLRAQIPGALLAVGIWIVASYGLGWYLQHIAGANQTYGTLGAVIALMLWLFFTALAILIGAELNAELLRLERIPPSVKRRARHSAAV